MRLCLSAPSRLQTACLAARSSLRPRLPSLPPPLPRLPCLPLGPCSRGTPGGEEGGCPLARSLAPLAPFHRPRSLRFPASEPSRDLGGKNASELLGCLVLAAAAAAAAFFFFFFLLVINPDEVSCLRFPFRAVVFLARDECFGGPRPLVFWGGLACKGAGVLNTFGNYSFLVVVEGVGQPRALPLLIPRRWADGGTGIWGSRGWERGVRLHLRCLSACGDSGHLDRTAQASEEEVAGFLVATVFVFWALRDSVLAPDGCSLLFLNSILLYFFFSRGASSVLKKKKKIGNGWPERGGRQQASECRGPHSGRVERPSPSPPAFLTGRSPEGEKGTLWLCLGHRVRVERARKGELCE